MKLAPGSVIDVVNVEPLSGYQLKLRFSDGAEQVIDFEPFLRKARHPQIRAYLDPAHFANFRLEYGDLVWDDYDLADLYENKL